MMNILGYSLAALLLNDSRRESNSSLREVEKAVEYVLLGQDGELPPFDCALPSGRATAPNRRVFVVDLRF